MDTFFYIICFSLLHKIPIKYYEISSCNLIKSKGYKNSGYNTYLPFLLFDLEDSCKILHCRET